jgi:hypothetical protein
LKRILQIQLLHKRFPKKGTPWRYPSRQYFYLPSPDNHHQLALSDGLLMAQKMDDFAHTIALSTLSDVFPDEDEIPTKLKLTRQQFVDIIAEWYEKVCKHKPKEVIIKHENDHFFIETKN